MSRQDYKDDRQMLDTAMQLVQRAAAVGDEKSCRETLRQAAIIRKRIVDELPDIPTFKPRPAERKPIKNNPDKNLAYRLKYNYGISVKRYSEIFQAQGRVCAICHKTPDKPLVVDHCHKTDKVRQLLCRNCNSGIGFLQDNPAVIHRASQYLLRHQSLSGDAYYGA